MKENNLINKIIVDRNEINDALQKLNNTINKKFAHEITANIKIESKKQNLILYATNYETYQKMTINLIESQKDCVFIINGNDLIKIFKILNYGEVSILVHSDSITIKQNSKSIKLHTIFSESDNFPEHVNKESFNKKCVEKLNISNKEFLHLINKIKHACTPNKDIQNQAMKGVLLENIESKFNIVATDAKRLAYISIENKDNIKTKMIISKLILDEIDKIFAIKNTFENDDEKNDFANECQDFDIYTIIDEQSDKVDMIGFENANNEFFTKVINSEYPNYRSIIKDYENAPLKVPRVELLDYIRIASNLGSKESEFIFTNESIIVKSCDDNETISYNFEIHAENELKEDLHVFLTNAHILENIKLCDDEYIEFFIDHPNKPILIKNTEFNEIVMPFNR